MKRTAAAAGIKNAASNKSNKAVLARAIAAPNSVEEAISNRDNNSARPGREANSARVHPSAHHSRVAHREAARPSNRVEETGTALRKTGETGIPIIIIKTNGEISRRAKNEVKNNLIFKSWHFANFFYFCIYKLLSRE